MSLRAQDFEQFYSTDNNDFISDFFVPALKDAIRYDRAVGYFSSTSLISISRGIYSLVQNGGTIRVIASPHLSQSDYEAIEQGYRSRGEVTYDALLRALRDAQTDEEVDRLNLMAYLIATKRCEIKIAMIKSGAGIFHDKVGIVEDLEGNKVAFCGSLNETANALESNYESISVYCEWEEKKRFDKLAERFETLWDDNNSYVNVKKFESLDQEIIKKYLRKDRKHVNRDITQVYKEKQEYSLQNTIVPSIPISLQLHDYQKEAVEAFLKQDGRGIFDMATGTGKTLTALAAMTAMSNKLNNILGVIIVVPYKHLIPQWLIDIEIFGIKDTICCSSDYNNWQSKLNFKINTLKFKKTFFCCISTQNTFCSDKFQNSLKLGNLNSTLIIVDEAHNIGAINASKILEQCEFKYRLALSATIQRHHDETGSAFLEQYFGKRCIEYGLDLAIREGYLTPYEYHPIYVSMDSAERDQYISLTKQISKALNAKKENEASIPKSAKNLLILRSKLVANIKSKIPTLKEAISPFKRDSNILVYCGASYNFTDYFDEYPENSEDIQPQIQSVVNLLSGSLSMKVSTFTSLKNSKERAEIIDDFKNKRIQAIVAIKCLDEGVSINNIQRAFILASTTNPKEYIQRRGRVLRLSKGKEKAYIYDFIVLPYDKEECKNLTFETLKPFRTLVSNEMLRFKEFCSIATNPQKFEGELGSICSYFQIDHNKLTNYEVDEHVKY